MASSSHASDPAQLLSALLSVIEQRIVPLTAAGVAAGSKLFGAAILRKADLLPLTVATNDERVSPLLHGEINCIQQFFTVPVPIVSADSAASSPASSPAAATTATKDCVFLATHEPCSLCLSGIAWAGFDNVYYLFTYEDSRDRFAIPHDIRILEEVFRVRAEGGGESDEDLARRPLYNRKNKFFTATSFAEVVASIGDGDGDDAGERGREREKWAGEVERVKGLYDGLSRTYQYGKANGVGSASVWK